MQLTFTIPVGEHNYYYTLLPNGKKAQTISHVGTIFLGIYKIHNHRYELTALLYRGGTKYISPRYYKTKAELHGAIQKLLQEEL